MVRGCEKELVKLKQDFDNEEKSSHERSDRFKEEKSKDFMTKNINRDDMGMRNAMNSRIMLNKQLGMGFQFQRQRVFNQSKK